MEKIDNLDRQILEIISQNARIPFKDVAAECGVSRAAIHQRVQRLIDLGVIIGSGYHVNPKSLGYRTCTYIGIKLEKGSTVLENGKRELLEETGAVGYSYISLGQVYPSPGYTSEIIHLYACRVKSEGKNNPDEGEFLNVEKISLGKAVEMVLNNQIPDAKTQIAVLKTSMLLQSGKI